MFQLVINVETAEELKAIAERLQPETEAPIFICRNKIFLLRDVKNLIRQCVERNRMPLLTEVKDVIWSHFDP